MKRRNWTTACRSRSMTILRYKASKYSNNIGSVKGGNTRSCGACGGDGRSLDNTKPCDRCGGRRYHLA